MLILLAASWWDRNAGAVGLAGLIVTAIGLGAGFAFYLLQRDTKTLDWQLLTNEPILTRPPDQALGGIRVLWNDEELEYPSIVTVRLINTGKREIRPEDFDGDVIVRVKPSLSVRSAAAIRNREGMRHLPLCSFQSNECRVAGVLYNRGDWVDVQLLVDSSGDHETGVTGGWMPASVRSFRIALGQQLTERARPVTVDSVIAGQTRPSRKFDPGSQRQARQLLVSFMLSIVALIVTTFLAVKLAR